MKIVDRQFKPIRTLSPPTGGLSGPFACRLTSSNLCIVSEYNRKKWYAYTCDGDLLGALDIDTSNMGYIRDFVASPAMRVDQPNEFRMRLLVVTEKASPIFVVHLG